MNVGKLYKCNHPIRFFKNKIESDTGTLLNTNDIFTLIEMKMNDKDWRVIFVLCKSGFCYRSDIGRFSKDFYSEVV